MHQVLCGLVIGIVIGIALGAWAYERFMTVPPGKGGDGERGGL